MVDDQDKVDQGEEDKSFLAPGCLEKRSFCDNEQKNEESLLTYRFGWNSFGERLGVSNTLPSEGGGWDPLGSRTLVWICAN